MITPHYRQLDPMYDRHSCLSHHLHFVAYISSPHFVLYSSSSTLRRHQLVVHRINLPPTPPSLTSPLRTARRSVPTSSPSALKCLFFVFFAFYVVNSLLSLIFFAFSVVNSSHHSQFTIHPLRQCGHRRTASPTPTPPATLFVSHPAPRSRCQTDISRHYTF